MSLVNVKNNNYPPKSIINLKTVTARNVLLRCKEKLVLLEDGLLTTLFDLSFLPQRPKDQNKMLKVLERTNQR